MRLAMVRDEKAEEADEGKCQSHVRCRGTVFGAA